jgi:hypothetical protein
MNLTENRIVARLGELKPMANEKTGQRFGAMADLQPVIGAGFLPSLWIPDDVLQELEHSGAAHPGAVVDISVVVAIKQSDRGVAWKVRAGGIAVPDQKELQALVLGQLKESANSNGSNGQG